MGFDINFQVLGMDNLQTMLRSLSGDMLDTVLQAYGTYLVGDDSHGLRHYSPYEYVSRSSVYSPPFVSDKQRRFVMASIADGTITPGEPHRTQNLADSWRFDESGTARYTITNSAPYAPFVMGDESQSAMAKRGGWRTISQNIKDNAAGALRAASQALYRLIQGK